MTFKQPALVNSPTSPVWKKPSESAAHNNTMKHNNAMRHNDEMKHNTP